MQGALTLLANGGDAYNADMANELGSALRAARKSKGMTLHDVAKAIGVSYPAVQQWESGKTTPTPDRLASLARLLGVDPLAYMSVKSGLPPQIDPTTLPENVRMDDAASALIPRRSHMRQDVPVLGVAVGGTDADFSFNGTVADYVMRPPAITQARGVYAVHVVNDSMYPAHREGTLLFVNPNRTPAIGDDVVIETHGKDGEPGPAFIKRLKKRTPTKVVVEQFNPPGEIEFDRERIKALHRVIPFNELLGV